LWESIGSWNLSSTSRYSDELKNKHITLRTIDFIEDHKVIEGIIRHLKLTFEDERSPPPQITQQELLMAAEERREYF
jgi:hypothetical protein